MQRFTEYFTLVLLAALLLWANEAPRFSNTGRGGLDFDGYGAPFIYGRSQIWRNRGNLSYSSCQSMSIDTLDWLADAALALVLLGATASVLRKRRPQPSSDKSKPWYRGKIQFGLSSLLVVSVVFGILLWANTWEIVILCRGDAWSERQSWFMAATKGWPFPYEIKPLGNMPYEAVRNLPLTLDVFCAFLIALDLGLLWECYVLRPKKASLSTNAIAPS
ncbi:MAG: hypothetical protein HY291_05600 [Planctomycetes bacterium]|nr:hypothetical protein [Planctomycetota bacterium]